MYVLISSVRRDVNNFFKKIKRMHQFCPQYAIRMSDTPKYFYRFFSRLQINVDSIRPFTLKLFHISIVVLIQKIRVRFQCEFIASNLKFGVCVLSLDHGQSQE